MATSSSSSSSVSTIVPIVALVMLALILVPETQAQCPTNDLSSCLPAAVADVQPTDDCCTNLEAYTQTATPADCICQLASDNDLNPQFAVLIPQKCNLNYPAGITCMGYVIPGGQ